MAEMPPSFLKDVHAGFMLQGIHYEKEMSESLLVSQN